MSTLLIVELRNLVELGWREQAACLDADPELFYPESDTAEASAAALEFCRRCPVVEQCYEYALENRERSGVWGGTTGFNRRQLLQPRSAQAGRRAGCGSDAGYKTHRRYGEEACEACMVAHAAYNAAKASRRGGGRGTAGPLGAGQSDLHVGGGRLRSVPVDEVAVA